MTGQSEQLRTLDVTIEQLARLERGLLAMRAEAKGEPQVLHALAMTQFQEIQRLRTEIDELYGFTNEETADLVVSIEGPSIGLGLAPASVLSSTLSNVRTAIQSIAAHVVGLDHTGTGRYPKWIADATDFSVRGMTSGSLNIILSLPPRTSLFAHLENEPVEQSISLFLQTAYWVSSNDDIEALVKVVPEEPLRRLLLGQVRRVTPTRGGIVRRIRFSGRMVSTPEIPTLIPRSADRIYAALSTSGRGQQRVSEEGVLRAIDIDKAVFELRQRPENRPEIACVFAPELLPQALEALVYETRVIVTGVQNYDPSGRPTRLVIEDLQSVGDRSAFSDLFESSSSNLA